jgi:hypothetical protein
VVVFGWSLGRLGDKLRENDLAVVRVQPKRFANLERFTPFVAAITITPVAKG